MQLFALSVELGMDTSEFERGISQAKTKTAASVTEMKSQYKSLAASLGGYQSAFNKAAAQYGTSSQSAQKYSAKPPDRDSACLRACFCFVRPERQKCPCKRILLYSILLPFKLLGALCAVSAGLSVLSGPAL